MGNEFKDPAEFYRERTFPGKSLIAWGVGIWAIYWLLGSFVVRVEALPENIKLIAALPLIPACGLFLVGFWRAVKGKGHHPVLFLLAFTGLIGLVVLLFLPDKRIDRDSKAS